MAAAAVCEDCHLERTITFHPSEMRNYEFAAWEEPIDGLVFVEFIPQTTKRVDRRLTEVARRHQPWLVNAPTSMPEPRARWR